MTRFLLALGVCAVLAIPAQAARHPDFRQYCRVYTVASGATAWKCWTRQSHYKARGAAKRRADVRHAQTVKHESQHGCGSLAAVRAAHAVACVAQSAASAFQGFVAALESTGYRIDFMGGWRAHGSCRGCNMHPRGLAIDINQTARNRVTRRFPAGVTALAAQYGLLHGAVWHGRLGPDTGHFELNQPGRYARRYSHGGRA